MSRMMNLLNSMTGSEVIFLLSGIAIGGIFVLLLMVVS